MQYASQSIYVGLMLVIKQSWILLLLKYKGPLKVRMPMRLVCNIAYCQFASVRCLYNEAIAECSRPILFRLKYDGPVIVRWPMQFVSVNLRRSDVCEAAILECFGQILFLLKYDGPVIVRQPMQFLQLSISVVPMFVFKQFRYVIVRSCFFLKHDGAVMVRKPM